MSRRRKPFTPTVIVVLLIFFGMVLILVGYAAPIVMKTESFEIITNSVGLVIIIIAVIFAADVIRHPIKTGRKGAAEIAFYDPPRLQNSLATIKCVSCDADMPRSQLICQNCGHKRPLY